MPARFDARPTPVALRAPQGRPLAPRRTRPGRLGAAAGIVAAAALATVAIQGFGTSQPTVAAPPVAPMAESAATPSLAGLPLDFVANAGQWDAGVEFVARRGAVAATFERYGVRLALAGTPVRLAFDRPQAGTTVVGEQPRRGTYNFLVGDDPTGWREGVAAFGGVRYAGVVDGIDVRFREAGRNLEYDLLVAPRADVGRFAFRIEGGRGLAVGADGSLVIRTGAGELRQTPPVAWNVLPDGVRQPVGSAFRPLGADRYGFTVTGADPALPLVIDPGIEWSTFVGGSGDEALGGMAAVGDGTGDVVIGGWTRSPEFPATGGVRASGSTFVARVAADGRSLVYATYYGGSMTHTVSDIAVDAGGNPLVVGDTNSKDFPVTPGAFDSTPPGTPQSPLDFGDYDGYVLRLNASGGGPLMATYLAGDPVTGTDNVTRAGYDPAGNPVVAGITSSANFPTTAGAYDRTRAGTDVFVARFNPSGTQLTYSTFLGGDGSDSVFDMIVGTDGAINLTGQTIIPTTGTRFPTTADAADRTTVGGDWEAFFTRLRPDGAGTADLRYSSYLGGDQYIEAGNGIALDPADPTLVTLSGFTRSGDFPTTPGALLRVHPVPVDGSMGWVARFRTPAAAAGSLLWSTLYGAPGNQTANDVVVDASGAAVIVGGTAVNNPPTTERAYDRIPANGVGTGDRADGYIARISADGSRLLASTLLGASAGEAVVEVVPAAGNGYVVAGITNSTDFPTTAGAYDRTYASDGRPSGNDAPGTLAEDIFVTRIDLEVPSADTTPPTAPAIAWPAEGTVFNLTSSDGVRVAFDWSDATDASGIRAYHLQVSPNAEFRNDLQAEFDDWYEPWSPTSFDSYFYCCSDSTNLTYSMRVQALDAAGNLGPWSPVRTFRLVSGSSTAPLTAPVLTSPPNNGRYAPGSITLAWNHVAGATSYTLEADTSSNFTSGNRIVASGLTVNTRAVTLTGDRSWFWRVRALRGTTTGPLSSVRTVQTRAGSPAAPVPPAGTPIPPPAGSGTGLRSLVMSPEVAFGSQTLTGTVTLHQAAPAGGAVVDLVSQYPSRVTVPATVTVPAGQTSATFTASSADGLTAVTATVMGTYGGSSQAWYVQAIRGEPTLVLGSLALSSATVQGGGQVTGTVAFGGIGFVPGPDGAVVHLATTNPAVASVPATVTIPAGASSTTFPITTTGVSTTTPVTIVATRSSMQTRVLEVLPAGGLSALSFNPATATGSGGSTGTVTLGGPAPAGGTVVSLSSSDARWVVVPASVTVPAGATSVTFTAATTADPTQGRFSSIRAAAGGIERFATLNVNPGAGGGGGGGTLPAPSLSSPANDARVNGGSVTFDWSDVAGAASYVLEIDDSSSFSNPLVRSVTPTASTAAVTGLPSRRLWWRVRAVGPTGTPGTTSGSRRFEIR